MAFRYTPTPTPSITPTISLTPSITPTITPSLTSCPDSCCFPNFAGSFSGTPCYIQFLKYNDDYSFFMFGNALDNLNGQTLRITNRISNCGTVLSAYTFTGAASFGGVDYGGVAKQSTGKTLLIQEKNIFRLNADYSIDTTFSSGYAAPAGNSHFPTGIAIGENDKYFAVGILTGWTYITGGTVVSPSTNIIRFNDNGTVDTSYSGFSIGITSSGLSEDPYMINDFNGKIIITTLTSFNGDTTKKGIIRLNTNGTLDTSFTSSAFSGVAGTTVATATALPNGKYMVGGSFTNLLGISTQDFLVRLNNDGTLDTTFVNGGAVYGRVKDVEPQSSGKYIVFTDSRLFRLNVDGSIDTGFTQGSLSGSSQFGSIAISPADTIIVGDNFLTYNSQSYRDFVKLDENGNLNMCPVPTTTPTNTPTMTQTPSPTSTQIITPTTTPTNTPTPSITPPSGELFVYAKYRNAESILQYQVNYGAYNVIGNIDSLTCQYFYTITGLTPGDVIYLTTYSGCILAYDTSSPCPNSGFACDQTYIFPGGTNYIYITVDGSICC